MGVPCWNSGSGWLDILLVSGDGMRVRWDRVRGTRDSTLTTSDRMKHSHVILPVCLVFEPDCYVNSMLKDRDRSEGDIQRTFGDE